MTEPIRLFSGDIRLDKLSADIENLIYERAGGLNIPIVSVIGLLERIKLRLNDELNKTMYGE